MLDFFHVIKQIKLERFNSIFSIQYTVYFILDTLTVDFLEK